ncbi:lytic transglycosylase domain-containing protein [Streptomyces sp. NPDC059785]|uniref:lytic transglycosylase domain-containing protein n=1 Tax=unclassified Streptomyces TaxID=2593676 RepID=UPI0036641B8D
MAAHFGSRLRKSAATTAIAAAAVAALSASQAPGVTVDDHGRQSAGSDSSAEGSDAGSTATGNSRYYTDLPTLDSPTATPSADDDSDATKFDIPATVLDAYKKAEASLRESKPACNLPWQLLAAIGKVESGHAGGGRVDAGGTTYSKILGPPLNGDGFANITDTDDGVYDGDTTHDRAVGPMQFIPSTWEWAGRDGNGDGVQDPNNVYDAALAAAHYLCRFDHDMSVQSEMNASILSYNNSTEYLNTVLAWLATYRENSREIPDGTGALPSSPSDSTTGATPGTTPSASTEPTPSTSGSSGSSGNSAGSGGSSTTKPPATTTPPATSEPSTPTTPPTPTDTVHHLENAGTGKLTATAGDAFTEKIAARTETSSGAAVAKVRVRFTITGDTDATFEGGEKVATVQTDSTGTATAPTLQAGEKTGDFTVRAAVVGRTLAGVDYTATVTARQADALARTSDTALTCTPGGEFADQVEVKATYKGAVAGKVAATATLIKSADDATENDKGPYFKDADGKAVRTLEGLTTDAKGLLVLPKLYADDETGTFLLRVTTTGGATLTVELTVAAAAS